MITWRRRKALRLEFYFVSMWSFVLIRKKKNTKIISKTNCKVKEYYWIFKSSPELSLMIYGKRFQGNFIKHKEKYMLETM